MGLRRLRFFLVRTGLRGVILRTEAAGNLSYDKCLYIGHTTGAATKMLTIMCMSIVRKLAQMIKFTPTSMDDLCDWTYGTAAPVGMEFSISTDESGNLMTTYGITGLSNTSTWMDVANSLASQLQTRIAEADSGIRVHEYRMFRQNDSATPVRVDVARLSARETFITFKTVSHLKIQNRTRAHTEAGLESAAAAQSSLNVENNPLEGRSYYKTGNGFRLKNNEDAANTFNLFGAYDSGLIDGGDIDTAWIVTGKQKPFPVL